MDDERRSPRIGSTTWYSRAENRLHVAWGRDRALDWIEHCAALGWWTLLLPTREWVWSSGMYALHGGERDRMALPPGAKAIVDRVVREERARVSTRLSVLDQAGDVRPEEVMLEYWVPSGGAIPRRIRLHGQLEPMSGTGRMSWIGCAQDVTDAYLSARALSALEAGEDALLHWRSFAPSIEDLLGRLAPPLESPLASAWTRGAQGRLEARVQWGPSGAAGGDHHEAADPADVAHLRSLARLVWVTREPIAGGGGFAVPATWHGQVVAALTFVSNGAPYLDEGLARTLGWVGSALGRRLTGDRPELGETRLSNREREVLQLAADGYDGPAIARHLLVSPATVKTHFMHVYEKLGVNDRAAAVARALRQGLIA